MCGIVAYIGKKPAATLLLEGLKRLEYRGYDSAGLAVAHDGGKPGSPDHPPSPYPPGGSLTEF